MVNSLCNPDVGYKWYFQNRVSIFLESACGCWPRLFLASRPQPRQYYQLCQDSADSMAPQQIHRWHFYFYDKSRKKIHDPMRNLKVYPISDSLGSLNGNFRPQLAHRVSRHHTAFDLLTSIPSSYVPGMFYSWISAQTVSHKGFDSVNWILQLISRWAVFLPA